MNVQRKLIQELMLNVFKLDHNALEATKNVCYAKGESAVDLCTVTRWFKKFHLSCKNVTDQAKSGWSKIMESEVVLQVIEANPV